MEDLRKDKLYLTNGQGMSLTDLEAVVNVLYQEKKINNIEFSQYKNKVKDLIFRVSLFLDNIEKKGPTVVELFYHAFEVTNKSAYDQLPSKRGGDVVDGPAAAPILPPEPAGSEVYVEKMNVDFAYLANEIPLTDVTLKLLVEALAIQQVFNPAEKDMHLNPNEELHRRVAAFLNDVKSKGRRPCYLFYRALEVHCVDLYASLPSSRQEAENAPIDLR